MGTVTNAGKMTERRTNVMVLYLQGGNGLKHGQINVHIQIGKAVKAIEQESKQADRRWVIMKDQSRLRRLSYRSRLGERDRGLR